VIKSYSADDIHKSIKYSVWASTEHGNKRLDQAFRDSAAQGPIYLFFSVNGSGCFCGMARMESPVDYTKTFGAWSQGDKWNGQFKVKWIFIKNILNKKLRHIRLANNQNKPVTNSRDTQEIFPEQGKQVLKIYHTCEQTGSILDEFDYFDTEEIKKTEEAVKASVAAAATTNNSGTAKPEKPPVKTNSTPQKSVGVTAVLPKPQAGKSGKPDPPTAPTVKTAAYRPVVKPKSK